jgi:hypothetical protein
MPMFALAFSVCLPLISPHSRLLEDLISMLNLASFVSKRYASQSCRERFLSSLLRRWRGWGIRRSLDLHLSSVHQTLQFIQFIHFSPSPIISTFAGSNTFHCTTIKLTSQSNHSLLIKHFSPFFQPFLSIFLVRWFEQSRLHLDFIPTIEHSTLHHNHQHAHLH